MYRSKVVKFRMPERTFEDCSQKALTFLTQRVFSCELRQYGRNPVVQSANALVFRNLTITADAIATQFVAVPLILASLSLMPHVPRTKFTSATEGQRLRQHDISVCVWAVFKIQEFVCKRFLPSSPPSLPPPPTSLLIASFIAL